jgi:hypothetical protein
VARGVITYAEAEARERAIGRELANEAARHEAHVREGRYVQMTDLLEMGVRLRRRLESAAGDMGTRVVEEARVGPMEAAVIRDAVNTVFGRILDALAEESSRDR